MIPIKEDKAPSKLPKYLWHGTKYLEFIAKDNLVMKTTQDRGFVEGIRFTSDPRKLKGYAVFPFWIKLSTKKMKPVDFLQVDGLWKEEDEYLYIANKTFDLKPHIEEIYVHDKVKSYFDSPRFKGKFYKHIESVSQKYNIPLIFGEKWLWEKLNESKSFNWKDNLEEVENVLYKKFNINKPMYTFEFADYLKTKDIKNNSYAMIRFIYNSKTDEFWFRLGIDFTHGKIRNEQPHIEDFFKAFLKKHRLNRYRELGTRIESLNAVQNLSVFDRYVKIAQEFFKEIQRIKMTKPRGVLRV